MNKKYLVHSEDFMLWKSNAGTTFNSLHKMGSGIIFFLHTWYWRSHYLLGRHFLSDLNTRKVKVHSTSQHSNIRLLNLRTNSSFHSHLILYPIYRFLLSFCFLYGIVSGHQHEKCKILYRRKEFKEVKLTFKAFWGFLFLSKCRLKVSDGFALERSNVMLGS